MEIYKEIPSDRAVLFSWINRYGSVIIRTSEFTVFIDPIRMDAQEVGEVDLILITHEHKNHLDPLTVRKLHEKKKATVVIPEKIAYMLRKYVKNDYLVTMNAKRCEEVCGIRIVAIEAIHPAIHSLAYLLSFKDFSIFHAGDSVPHSEMKVIGEKYKPLITFCPVGISRNLSPRSGFEIVKLTDPKVAIPIHTDKRKSLEEFSSLVSRYLPQVIAHQCEILEVVRVEFDEKQRVSRIV